MITYIPLPASPPDEVVDSPYGQHRPASTEGAADQLSMPRTHTLIELQRFASA